MESRDREHLLVHPPSKIQPEKDLSKTDEKSHGLIIAALNYMVGNTTLKTLPRLTPVTTSVMGFLIGSVVAAILLSLVSIWLYPKKAAVVLEYVALALTGSTSAIICYYLLISGSVS